MSLAQPMDFVKDSSFWIEPTRAPVYRAAVAVDAAYLLSYHGIVRRPQVSYVVGAPAPRYSLK